MSYIGNPIYQVAFVTDSFSGTGSTTVFTMSVAPANTASVLVVVSGVVQDPSTYSVSGTTLTFSAAPPSGTSNISARYLGIPASGVTTTAYRTVTEFTATAAQTTFTPPSYTVGFINVYLNGVLLGSADYTATNGTTVVLATGASAGNLVTVESFQVSSVLNAIPNSPASVQASNLNTTGTASSSTYLRGDMAWSTIATPYPAEYLIVAGGGGGSGIIGGGGGAGGVLYGITTLTSGTTYSFVVGSGGSSGATTSGNSGNNSTGFNLTAFGGGGGGTGSSPNANGTAGGCGGGGSRANGSGTIFVGGAGTAAQGFPGGSGSNTGGTDGQGSGGSGGGSGQQGFNASGSSGGNGGGGSTFLITGSAVTYAGGGGGGTYGGTAGSGGAGGGGAGTTGAVGNNGTANTGGGGGGAGYSGPINAGGNGGSGVVIVRVLTANYSGTTTGSPTVTTDGSYTVIKYTASGSYTA